jgi:predicted ATP-binding protein involved in virulence
MKITRLRMKSFRGISDLTLDFDPQLNVLIGDNGSGKSSILDCIAILLSFLTSEITSSILINKISSASDSSIEDIIYPKFDESDINNKVNETQLEGVFDFVQPNVPVILQLERGEIGVELSEEARLKFKEDIFEKLRNSLKANIPLCIFFKTNRLVGNINIDASSSRPLFFPQLEAYRSSISGQKIDFTDFFKWFRNQEDLENEEWRNGNQDHRDLRLEAVRRAIISLLPEFNDLQVKRSQNQMVLKKQGEEISFNQLSDGEKCLLAMVGDLARRLAIANPGLENPLQGSGIVLIDEIELHLHPKWQRMIIPGLVRTFPNCQFIVTTHSPQVLGEVKDGKIFRLANTEVGVTAEPVRTYGRDSNRILENEMGVPKRSLEIKNGLLDLFRLIDDGNLLKARELQTLLKEKIGFDEPEFAKADVLIQRKEVLGR